MFYKEKKQWIPPEVMKLIKRKEKIIKELLEIDQRLEEV